MTGPGSETVGVDTKAMMRAADVLTEAGRSLVREAGGVRRDLIVPDDHHNLRSALVGYDETREQFDRRAGEALEDLGFDLATQAISASDADVFPSMPKAAR